jgi:hypothetical protein
MVAARQEEPQQGQQPEERGEPAAADAPRDAPQRAVLTEYTGGRRVAALDQLAPASSER